jgi:anti-anti-sigma factor
VVLKVAVVPNEPLPVQWTGKQAVVTLPEHVDAANSDQVRERLLMLINRGAEVLIADMTATASCDYGGAEALVRAHHRAAMHGTQLRVAAASPLVRRVLTVHGVDRLVSVYPSLDAALAGRPPRSGLLTQPSPRARGDETPPGPPAITRAVLWSLLDALTDGIVLVTSDGVISLANQRAEDIFGYQHGELVGLPVEALVPAPLREAHVTQRARYQAQPADRPMGDRGHLVGLRKDGTAFPMQVRLSPVPTATGSFTLAVVRDIASSPPRLDLADLARTLAAGRESSGRELLDRVISSLYHVGLTLQRMETLTHDQAVRRIEEALRHLDDLIQETRHHLFTSGDASPPGDSG